MMQTAPTKRILRLPSVKAITGLSRSTIYFLMSEGSFPRQINLGARSIGWIESEIAEWIDSRVSGRVPACPLRSGHKRPGQGEAETIAARRTKPRDRDQL